MPILLALVFCLAASPQDAAPAFEVASVKIDRTGPQAGNGFFPSPGGLRVVNMTLRQLIQAAYHVKTGLLFGTAGWMDADRFDIAAKAAGKASFDDELTMLQALLAERFRLRFHRETRQLKTLALVPAKGGPKFRPSNDQQAKEHIVIRATEISGSAIPFGHFVSILEAQLGYPIANETGLAGQYDLALRYARDDAPGGESLSVYAALEEQLGLKLETRRGPVQVFVIDSAERPAGN